MKIAIVAGGFTPGEADKLRRAMATFKRTGTIGTFKTKMIEGMVARDYPRDFAERCKFSTAGVGEQDVDRSRFFFYDGKEAVQIGEAGHVALNAARIFSNLGNRRIEFLLAPAAHENTRAFLRKTLCRREADSAVCTRYHCHFSTELTHLKSPDRV